MKRLERWSVVVGLAILFCMSFNISARSARYMTKAKFIDLIIRIMDLEVMLPADAELMTIEELYDAEVELLARRGIYNFLGSRPHQMVKRKELVDFLYLAIVEKIPEDITDEEKLAFLIEKGFLKKGKLDEIMTEKEIIRALNIPEIVTAIAETYIAPGSAETITDTEFPEPLEVYEEPASPIY